MSKYDDIYDNPNLNKCWNCGAFFQSDICPICKSPCSEDMRAGNRKILYPKRLCDVNHGSAKKRVLWVTILVVVALGATYLCFKDEINSNIFDEVYEQFPINGTINAFWVNEGVVSFTIINEKPEALFIRFKQSEKCVFEVFVRESSTASFKVPPGVYSVNIAGGDTAKWQGDVKHFGKSTSYTKAERITIPNNGLTLTIENSSSVNGELKPSSKNSFNK